MELIQKVAYYHIGRQCVIDEVRVTPETYIHDQHFLRSGDQMYTIVAAGTFADIDNDIMVRIFSVVDFNSQKQIGDPFEYFADIQEAEPDDSGVSYDRDFLLGADFIFNKGR